MNVGQPCQTPRWFPSRNISTTYPEGDREYLDGLVVERNGGTPLPFDSRELLARLDREAGDH